jgi:hypothetical protein
MNGLSPAAELEAQIALTHYHLGDVAAARKTALAIKSEYEKARALLEIGEAEAAAGRQAAAREFLLAAAHAAESVRPGAPGDWPPASGKNATLRMIAEQQAKVGDVREALRTVESIGTEQERENALVSVAPAQAAAGDVKGALQTLARIKANAEKERALEDIVAALVNAGDERGALGVVEGQKSPALKARALLGLAKGRAKAKAGKS